MGFFKDSCGMLSSFRPLAGINCNAGLYAYQMDELVFVPSRG